MPRAPRAQHGWTIRPLRRIGIAILAAGLAAPAIAGREQATERAAQRTASTRPRLVVLMVVDQLRRDRLGPELPGGLGRVMREGRRYTRAQLAHAISETCPGHAALSTGRHPGPAGIPSNLHIARTTGERRYCAEDPAPGARVLGAPVDSGRSPRQLRVDAIGDWLRAADPRGRVHAVSGKDRAAIMLGGRRPHGAWWIHDARGGRFTTSAYYREALPRWIEDFNTRSGDGLIHGVPGDWTHPPRSEAHPDRPDDYAAERDAHGRTSPHAIHGTLDEHDRLSSLRASPLLDRITLEFALELAERERLGEDEVTDLLAVSLSGTDYIGHAYGPESAEAEYALRMLDADLGVWIEAVEARVGASHLLLALTSDHGVLPLPEWLVETGRSTCGLPSGRTGLIPMAARLLAHLHLEFGPLVPYPDVWANFSGTGITIDRDLLAKSDYDLATIRSSAKRWLEQRRVIAKAWTLDELERSTSPIAALYRNSYDSERSGDLMLQLQAGCLLGLSNAGTTHGSPYAYDRDIPLVISGPGLAAGNDPRRAFTVDLAPTLMHLLGLEAPKGLDGTSLVGRTRDRSSSPADGMPPSQIGSPTM